MLRKDPVVTKTSAACQWFGLHSGLQAGFSINKGGSAERHGQTLTEGLIFFLCLPFLPLPSSSLPFLFIAMSKTTTHKPHSEWNTALREESLGQLDLDSPIGLPT